MVYEITKDKNKVFIETLVIAILILLIGFSLGFYFEYLRVNNAVDESRTFEIEALDLKLQNYYYQIMDKASCDEALKQNLLFADDLYNMGLTLDKYEEANKISDEILREKRKYVLLKTELWLNSILLKEKCKAENEKFHTIVYLYSNDKTDLAKNGEQMVVSNTLKELKEKRGNDIILLPIAGDLGLKSVDLQMKIYNITYLPSIIIDEKTVLTSFNSVEDIEKYLN
jgi:hypothetical protein